MSHMTRVISEKHELDAKIGALNAFLSKGKPAVFISLFSVVSRNGGG